MAMDFPSSPTNGQTFIGSNGLRYVYSSTAGWSLDLNRYRRVHSVQTATSGQTLFPVTGGYIPNMVDVYKNGVKLVNGTQVTVTSGTAVTLASGATLADLIEIVGLAGFSTANGYMRSAVTLLTSSSGTYTPTTGVRAVLFEAFGAGGGSGGTPATSAGEVAIAGSGAAGGRGLKWVTSLAASYAYTVGAAGAAGASGANAGGTGGSTTIAGITAVGGAGGAAGAASNAALVLAAQAAGGTCSGGDENYTGEPSTIGMGNGAVQVARSGNGGSSSIAGGAAGVSSAAGAAGNSYGAGAAGAASLASASARAGAAGGAGVIRVTEFF